MVIARPIQGKHRTIKNRINMVLLALFFALPFVRIGGAPLFLLDIPARKFHIFGLEIWPHELYFLHLLLLGAGIMLFFFTALLGRVWCGYGCPQTIFIDYYDFVGKLFVGKEYGKKTLAGVSRAKAYTGFTLAAIVFSFVFLGYFEPYEVILADVRHGNVSTATGLPAAWVIFMIVSIGFALFNAGYFRENVCKYVCPYGRFQTALLDRHSPIVSYDVARGEPRREAKQKLFDHKGDCVDCNMCNLVCPTGIDIRQGLQVGCIACGLCVDACTQVLGKFNKETLIDYRTIEQVRNPDAERKYLRPRTFVYGTLLLIVLSIFSVLLVARVPIYGMALRDRAIQNVFVPGEGYQNGYELHIGNVSREPLEVSIKVKDSRYEILSPTDTYKIPPEGFEKIRFVVRSRENDKIARSRPIEFNVSDLNRASNSIFIQSVFTYPN